MTRYGARLRAWLRSARHARANERGAAIFIVLLVLTILTAVGTFAVQSAGLNQRSSGYMRKATQTGMVAEYGLLSALDTMSMDYSTSANPTRGDVTDQILGQMQAGTQICAANLQVDGGAEAGLPCYMMDNTRIQQQLQQVTPNALLFDPGVESLGPGPTYVAGTQPGPAIGVFQVEFTDEPIEFGFPAGSAAAGGTTTMVYVLLTVSSTAGVRPQTASAACTTAEDQYAAMSAATKTTRARVLIPTQRKK